MALNLASMFGQQPQTPTAATKYTGGGLTYDPSVYQQGVANSDPYAYLSGWTGLDSLGAGAGINGVIGDPNNPTGFNASRSLQPGDTRNGYEINTLGLNPDGTIKYDPNSWTFKEYAPDGGWLRPAATWAALASGTAGLGGALTGAAAAGGAGGLSGMDLAADAAAGTGNNIATAGGMLGGSGGIAGTGIPQFAQQPGYGQQFGGPLADASGGTPYTGAASGGDGAFLGEFGDAAAGGSSAYDPIGAYLTTGASEGSTIGNGLSGAGGATGAVGQGTLASLLGSIGGAASTIGNIPGVSKVGGNLVTNLLGSVLGGTGQGVSGAGNLGSLFTNYNQYKQNQDLINEIKGIYKPDGEYAKYLGDQLGRRDAAAGRNSQYGPRLAELMGRLGDSQARALSGLGGFMNSQQGGLNGMVGAGQRLLDGAGGISGLLDLFKGGSQGGMVPAPTTNGGQYIPNPDYNPVDDDWWSNPQYGP
jgi:hypothetical protein